MTDTVDNQALSCTLVFDFDSTLIANETLDILAEIVCAGRRDAEEVAAEIARITDMGMNGEIDLRESFARRFALLKPMREHIQLLAERLPTFLAHSAISLLCLDSIIAFSADKKSYTNFTVFFSQNPLPE
jgi:hypothetical protein